MRQIRSGAALLLERVMLRMDNLDGRTDSMRVRALHKER